MEEAYRQTAAEVLRIQRVDSHVGLSQAEAMRRLGREGLNELPRPPRTRSIVLFLERFRDILVLILVAAAIISVVSGHLEEAIIIAIAIFLDATLSFVQVWRTERTLEQMRKQVEDTVITLRDGNAKPLPSKYLVPGDIIEFRAGEQIPADARIIRVSGLKTQEAALTGESSDVSKDIRPLTRAVTTADKYNMVFAGTTVVVGSGSGVVIATGTRTEFGKIAQMLRKQPSPVTPLRQKLQRTGMYIGWAIIGAVVVLAGIGLLRGATLVETFHTAITLIVSAIPEDLTMILTIALTVGVRRILKQGGVVRTLSSGETLGAATVICTDKTGTLTEGNMRATGFHFFQGDTLDESARPQQEMHRLAYVGLALANDARMLGAEGTYIGSATERTALAFVEAAGMSQQQLRQQWRIRDTITFNTQWKYRAALVDHPTQATQTLFAIGAPDVLLLKSSQTIDEHNQAIPIDANARKILQEKIEALAAQGRRLVAVGIRRHLRQVDVTQSDVTDLLFLGVLAITDPVRHDVHSAIKQVVAAGVKVKLVTGDHAATALAVARQVGLPANRDTIITGETMQTMSDKELSSVIDRLTIFSRVEPLDKQRIVRLLQEKHHVVAMTGDGVNDAVALKGADIGVALQTGSDVAREAADLVLLNNSFATIVDAIKEGRILRDNIRKVIAFLLATNAAEVAIFFVSVLFGLPLPLLPAQILWINLVTDGTSDIALSLEPAENNVMAHRPEHPQAPLLPRHLIMHIIFSGVIMTIATVTLFAYSLRLTNDVVYARTVSFTLLATTSLLSVWSFRSLREGILKRGIWQNPWVIASTGFSFALHLMSLYIPSVRHFFGTVPLGLRDWIIILLVAFITVVVIDLRKLFVPDPHPAHVKHPRSTRYASLHA